MTDAAQAAITVPRGAVQTKRRKPLQITVILAFLGAFASAVVGAAIRFHRDRGVECVLLDSPATIRAGTRATLRFLLSNKTGRIVRLRPRAYVCGTQLEGVPSRLLPYESREISMVLSTTGLNGRYRSAAAISTDAMPRLVELSANVDIYADWVVRHVQLGDLPAGVPVSRQVRIDNVPTRNLVRVGIPEQSNWSARVTSTGDRFLEIELAATLPPLDAGNMERRDVCDFSLYFAGADVRRVQVIATAAATYNARGSGPSPSNTEIHKGDSSTVAFQRR